MMGRGKRGGDFDGAGDKQPKKECHDSQRLTAAGNAEEILLAIHFIAWNARNVIAGAEDGPARC
jgi:hypothetical protein